MRNDTTHTMEELAARLFALPMEDYLGSDEFSRFAREYGLHDTWREYLRLSEDRPDLYGSSVTRNAFSLFLNHHFNESREDFLPLLVRLLADFSRGLSCHLPVDTIREGLLPLGYTGEEIDHALFILRVRVLPEPEPAENCCPDGQPPMDARHTRNSP